jgi:hypothetical protein
MVIKKTRYLKNISGSRLPTMPTISKKSLE